LGMYLIILRRETKAYQKVIADRLIPLLQKINPSKYHTSCCFMSDIRTQERFKENILDSSFVESPLIELNINLDARKTSFVIFLNQCLRNVHIHRINMIFLSYSFPYVVRAPKIGTFWLFHYSRPHHRNYQVTIIRRIFIH
jgi:hypothetical protein